MLSPKFSTYLTNLDCKLREDFTVTISVIVFVTVKSSRPTLKNSTARISKDMQK